MRSSLVLASVTASSFGLYSCRARNQLGEAVLQLTLRPVGESSKYLHRYPVSMVNILQNSFLSLKIFVKKFQFRWEHFPIKLKFHSGFGQIPLFLKYFLTKRKHDIFCLT